MLFHTYEEMQQLIVDNIPKIRQLKFDIIVHLPRSGTTPAAILATYLRKPLASIDEFCKGIVWTRNSPISNNPNPTILLVDDSIRTGYQMAENIAKIKATRPNTIIKTLAIFQIPCPKDRTQLYNIDLALFNDTRDDYIYPWLLWKCRRIENFAVDMDGVLCEDCPIGSDDDGEKYMEFIKNAPLKFRTDHNIGTIITSRLEKYRPETVEWLWKNGQNYKKLIMGPWKSLSERRSSNPAIWKANEYNNIPLVLYIESSVRQAEIIGQHTKKTVYCIDNSKVYNNGYFDNIGKFIT